MEHTTEIVLVGVIAAQVVLEVYLLRQIQKLVDKIMSRNYGEYIQGQTMLDQKAEPVKLMEAEDPDTDLNIMRDFAVS